MESLPKKKKSLFLWFKPIRCDASKNSWYISNIDIIKKPKEKHGIKKLALFQAINCDLMVLLLSDPLHGCRWSLSFDFKPNVFFFLVVLKQSTAFRAWVCVCVFVDGINYFIMLFFVCIIDSFEFILFLDLENFIGKIRAMT